MTCRYRPLLAWTAALAFYIAITGAGWAQQPEKTSIRLGVGNKSHLYYLPLTLAERRGHFKEYGLDSHRSPISKVEESARCSDGRLVDVVTGAYEHTLRMQAKGRDVRALIELGRFPGIVLAVHNDRGYKSHGRSQGNENRRDGAGILDPLSSFCT